MEAGAKQRLTVVTVVLNDPGGLESTTRSLISLCKVLSNTEIRHIVIDGKSNDGTLGAYSAVLAQADISNLSHEIVCEPDRGIFDAMNKAAGYLREGEIVWYLNAGDCVSEELDPAGFELELARFAASPAVLLFFVAESRFGSRRWHLPLRKIDPAGLKAWLARHTPVHQAILFKHTSRFPIHYPLAFRIQADSILIYYLVRLKPDFLFADNVLCIFKLGGLSGDYRSFRKVIRQTFEQYCVYLLRAQPLYSFILLPILMAAKFALHSILGDRFYELHSLISQIRYR